MQLEELQVYQLAMEMGERIWNLIVRWDFFARDTVGKQLIRSADSVATNLSEGFGRFSYKENKQFSYYARGSLYETKTWLTKAHNRKLLPPTDFDSLQQELETIAIKLDRYINSIGKQPSGAQPSPSKNR
jgi:four helix bundle protein